MTITSSRLWRVDWLPRVGHLCHEPVHVVRRVGGRLDTTVGEGDREGANNVSSSVLSLGLLEVGLAVVIVDSVLVGERLGGKLLLLVGGSSVVGGGGGVGWSVVGNSHGEEGGGDEELQ